MTVVGNGEFRAEARQVFQNLQAVAEAAGGTLTDIVKLNAYLTDLGNFAVFNEVMAEFIAEPLPRRRRRRRCHAAQRRAGRSRSRPRFERIIPRSDCMKISNRAVRTATLSHFTTSAMAHYAIGDIQGRFDELTALLSKINFKNGTDTLW